jgi:malonyl-CoA decarboxylase
MSVSSFFGRLFGGAAAREPAQVMALCRALLGERGEASGAQLAREVLAAYQTLDAAARERLFDALASDFSPAPAAVGEAARAYERAPSAASLARVQAAAESPRQELFRRLNMASGGTAALVEMRRQVLAGAAAHPAWEAIDADLLHLLRSWFNRGFLRLERIDWRTPALVLEKLMRYEAVHAIQGWDDLRRRLAPDRRCFAFFHPQLPDEPLIFIEVALTESLSAAVQPLLEPGAPVGEVSRARCATFFSISNCQDGLRGISFGNFLIKQVAEELRRELPGVRKFATLSPIPGFRRWLEEADTQLRLGLGGEGEARLGLLRRLADPDWLASPRAAELERLLMPLCAHYLTRERRGAEPLDPVLRFHLGNGASLERLNWRADISAQGLAQSGGIMANYLYRLRKVEHNHELFVREHRIVASREVERLAREAPLEEGAAAAAGHS